MMDFPLEADRKSALRSRSHSAAIRSDIQRLKEQAAEHIVTGLHLTAERFIRCWVFCLQMLFLPNHS